MAEGHVLHQQGGQQAAQHRRRLPQGHVLYQRGQRQTRKKECKNFSMRNTFNLFFPSSL